MSRDLFEESADATGHPAEKEGRTEIFLLDSNFLLILMHGSSGRAQGGENLPHEFLQSSLARFVISLGLSDRFFPRLGKARGLFSHQPDRIFDDRELAKLGPSGLLLDRGKIHSEIFVLLAEILQFSLQAVISFGIHLELGVEVLLELLAFLLNTLHFPLHVSLGGKAGFPGEEGDKQAKKQTCAKFREEIFLDEFHDGF